MMPPKELEIVTAGVTAVIIAGVWTWRIVRGRRRKSPAEVERLRRLDVNACGRIISGRVVELAEPVVDGPAGLVLLYDYEVAGVTYQAAQDVSALSEIAAAAPFLPGQPAAVKYDPKQPTNSILACEDWCGIPGLEPRLKAMPNRAKDSADSSAQESS